jgi:copper chaperone CopZ
MNTLLCGVAGVQNKATKTQIKNVLGKIEGVGEVGVDMAAGSVRVEYNEPATEGQIRSRLADAGFKII